MLIDADGLHWLKTLIIGYAVAVYDTACWRSGNVVIDICGTHRSGPHKYGEALAAAYECNAVLKGPARWPLPHSAICAHGGPAMATAGMGDALCMCRFARAGICSGQY